MYLKRLEIKGFKSFANSTEIYLKPGINIVVGPNGCGKSNIVDAIRWVIGESNIRHLRGQKSEDVIFNGTDNQKALGMAYVEMTVDNSDNVMPVDYSEVTLARKIFRSGESEFYINKTRVRLKDITNLFTGTGLGKRGYSIISQGELEQVLNGTPLDRRLILEEASGIIKYRQQRDETRKRIQDSSNDLIRLNDILIELKQRQSDVHNKAEKAKQYLHLAEEYEQLEKTVLQFEITKRMKDLSNKSIDLETKQNELKQQQQIVKSQETILRQEEEKVQTSRNSVSELMNNRHKSETELASMQSEIRLAEERVKNNHERIKMAETDEQKYIVMVEKINSDLEVNIADFEAQKDKYAETVVTFKNINDSVKELEKNITICNESFEQEKGAVFEQIRQESQVKNEILEKEAKLKKDREKKERISIHVDAAKEEYTQQTRSYSEIEQQKQSTEKDIKKNEILLDELNQQKTVITNSLKEIEGKYSELNTACIQVNNKIISIKEMQKNMVGYSQGVKSVLNYAHRGQLKGILGLMGEIIDVPQGMELAIDIAAGKALENVVVENVAQARQAIEVLKSKSLGRVTFLPLDVLKVQKVPKHAVDSISSKKGVLGIGPMLVNYDRKFEKAVQYLLGRVLVVQDMEKGIEVFKEINYPFRIVTLEGELINVSGALTGGNKPSQKSSPLQRRGEEKGLQELQEKNQAALAHNRREAENIKIELNKLDDQINSVREKLMESRFKHDIQVKQMDVIKNEIKNRKEERELYIQQILKLDEDIEQFELHIKDLYSLQRKMKDHNEVLNEDLNNLKDDLESKKRDFEVQKERLNSYKEQLDMKKRELDNIKKNIEQFEQVKSSYQKSLCDASDLQERLQKGINEQESRIRDIQSMLTGKKEELEYIKAEILEMQERETQCENRIEKIRNEIIPIRQRISFLENNIRNTEISFARLETEFDGLQAKWREKFNCDIPDCEVEVISPGKMRDYRKRIDLLQKQIEAIGPVDLESIEEYKEISQRFDFTSKQYEDLIQAKNSLEILLDETEKLMYKDFTHFFLLASESFKKTFKEIFGGGEASLKLETVENCLESGVDIEVKMPGKRTQSLNLLSGGERALTCIAFIFSLLRLKPAPFCLLDEIDAALDETNLIRFSDYLREMAREIQYIVITHRQTTIESGDNIYGITMPEKGVSSVLTINLSEAESMAG